MSKTAALMRHLREHGPATSAELRDAIGLPNTGRVSALLNHREYRGEVALVDGVWEIRTPLRKDNLKLLVDIRDDLLARAEVCSETGGRIVGLSNRLWVALRDAIDDAQAGRPQDGRP